MIHKLQEWWRGEYVADTLEHVLRETEEGAAYYKRPWIARCWVAVSSFLVREWKWTLGFVLTVIGIVITALKI